MTLDWGKIEKMWQDFTENHGMTLQDIDQHLIINKRQIYSAIEQFDNYKIHYRYVFYKLDTINVGNDFRIIIPTDTDFKLLIYKPNLLGQIVKRRKIIIKSSDKIQINDKIQNLIISKFREHRDLKIRIGTSIIQSDLINNGQNILEIQTKILPIDINGLEKLREIIIIVYDYLIDNKLIKNIDYKNARA